MKLILKGKLKKKETYVNEPSSKVSFSQKNSIGSLRDY
jgi:hypothetical protein